jgi:6-phosphogluconolactonase
MTPELIVKDTDALQGRLVSEFEKLAPIAIARRGTFVIALPGGSVAATFFPALSKIAIDWTHTDFFWTDERAVPPEGSDSNYAVASTLWLRPARVPASRIHRMRGEEPDLEAAARIAAEELRAVAGDPPRLDIALVGVGEDGHVASIFPDRALPHGLVVAIDDAPKHPPRRLTMTLPVLANAGRTILAAVGPSKATAVRDALQRTDCETPAAKLLRLSQAALVLLDRQAAGLLKAEPKR